MERPRVARSLEELRALSPRSSAVTLGVFDGVHVGHRRVVDELVRAKRIHGIESCYLMTFDPHPLVVTHSRMTPPMLTTVDERIALLSEYELDGIFVLKFDERVAGLDYRDFLERYLIRPFDMRHLVLGYDCHFGHNREGSPERVRNEAPRFGISVNVVPAVAMGDEIVSSTAVRNALIRGDLVKANEFLGHPYLLSGRVVRGHGRGHGLGFPTANLDVADPYKLWPPRGVYAVRVETKGRMYDGMMNIGRAPTVKELPEEAREAEVHLFDFEGGLYDEEVRVYCCRYIRAEKRFASPADLSRQLASDRVEAARVLREAERADSAGGSRPKAPGTGAGKTPRGA
jgi:riboflavin kinase/FMN adenylyltransferase